MQIINTKLNKIMPMRKIKFCKRGKYLFYANIRQHWISNIINAESILTLWFSGTRIEFTNYTAFELFWQDM